MSESPINLIRQLEERFLASDKPDFVKQYFTNGCYHDVTMRENIDAFRRIQLLPNYLTYSCDELTQNVTLMNGLVTLPSPIAVAPTSMHKLLHQDGEVAMARACKARGTVMIVSLFAHTSIEDIAATGAHVWQQVYNFKHKQNTVQLVKRAEAAGARAIVASCEVQGLGNRRTAQYNDQLYEIPMPNMIDYKNTMQSDPGSTWEYIDWIRTLTKLPIVIKGVITAENARQAVDHGANAVIVSTHGGRVMDELPAAIDQLSEVVAAVGDQVDVYFDSGVRSGLDVFKAIALGAKLVFVGRPTCWGLAYNGQAGVELALDILNTEFSTAMRLTGCPTLSHITKERIRLPRCACGCRL